MTAHRAPFTEKGLWHALPPMVPAGGLPAECSSHGLRKLGLVRLAEQDCTTEELKAISGHRNAAELKPYLEAASQKRLSASAMEELKQRQAVPASVDRVA